MDDIKNHFIDRTIYHIRLVQNNMILLEKNRDKLPFDIPEWEILRRSLKHDFSKFSSELIEGYLVVDEYYKCKRNNLSTEHIDMEKFQYAIDRHVEIELHHPNKKEFMSPLDICEMCSDIVAIAQEYKEKDYTEYYLTKQKKIFPLLNKYNNEILHILKLLEKLTV
ncbi:MAG TPA: DUF5662 family protein [Rickettsiales bacterium]|nr:DUF5662 family protein [Rickettsiales bacterium]